MTDLDCALAAQAIYLGPSPAFDTVMTIQTNTFGIRRADNLIACQGTEDIIQLIKDADAVPVPLDDGFVDFGFYFGMQAVFGWLKDNGVNFVDWLATGHSLGAADAMILAYLAQRNGTPLRRAVGLGTPRGMSETLCAKVRAVTPGAEYGNHHDPVWNSTSDPPYGRVYTPTVFEVKPPPSLNPFRYHRVVNYIAGLGIPGVALA